MNLTSVGFLVLGIIVSLMALIGVMGALKGTPVTGTRPAHGSCDACSAARGPAQYFAR